MGGSVSIPSSLRCSLDTVPLDLAQKELALSYIDEIHERSVKVLDDEDISADDENPDQEVDMGGWDVDAEVAHECPTMRIWLLSGNLLMEFPRDQAEWLR